MESRPMSEEEVRRYLANGLRVDEAVGAGLTSHKIVACVWVDMSERPDVADLARVHRMHGKGTARIGWYYLNVGQPTEWHILHVSYIDPVTTTFYIPFAIPRWLSLIEILSRSSVVNIASSPPPNFDAWINKYGREEGIKRMLRQEAKRGMALDIDEGLRHTALEAFTRYRTAHPHPSPNPSPNPKPAV